MTRLLLACLVLLPACALPDRPVRRAAADRLLERFHRAASEADGATYFSLFAPDGVFIGTDPGERWTVEELRAYAEPFFDEGRGWTYDAVERHVALSSDGSTAWFDEVLDNASYGRVRGSGVLVWRAGDWKLAHYVLSFAVPNDLAKDLVERIRAAE